MAEKTAREKEALRTHSAILSAGVIRNFNN